MFKRRMAHFLHILLTKTLRNLFFTVFAFLNTQIKYEKSGNEVCILPKENGEVLKEEMKKRRLRRCHIYRAIVHNNIHGIHNADRGSSLNRENASRDVPTSVMNVVGTKEKN